MIQFRLQMDQNFLRFFNNSKFGPKLSQMNKEAEIDFIVTEFGPALARNEPISNKNRLIQADFGSR